MAEDKTSKDDLTFEQALIKMLQERQGILSDIRATNRDISNDIQDQLQNSQLTAAEQKKLKA